MKRFYVQYLVDAGQLMICHDLIHARSWKEAMATWPSKVRGSVAYTRQKPEACFETPSFMVSWDRKAILDHYTSASFDGQFTTPGHHRRSWIVWLWQRLVRSA